MTPPMGVEVEDVDMLCGEGGEKGLEGGGGGWGEGGVWRSFGWDGGSGCDGWGRALISGAESGGFGHCEG